MRILDRIRRKRTFQFFSIFLLSIVLFMAVILVAQQARAVTPVYSVTVDTVNGAWPPPANIPNPVELTGTFSAQPGAGLEKEYGVQIAWGDGSPYTVWRYSDSANAYPYLTWNPNGWDVTYFTGTYSTNPGDGYPDLGHFYATGGTYTITVKFFHGQPPGAESADASMSVSVHVLVPEISVSKSGPEYAHEGDLLTYTITVSNPSADTTMYKVSVIDSLLGDLTASFSASLAPSTSESETFTYTVPSPSVNVLNTVTVTYEDLLDEQKTASASWTVTVLHPGINVSKSGPEYAHEGDLLTYTITVSNPSSDTMTKVSVIDSLLGDVSGSFSASLAPSTSESETFTYTVPSPSVNVLNTVTVTYEDAGNLPSTASASWTVFVLHPGISVSKSGPAYTHEGGVITYAIGVTNTGDCPLSSVSVTDTLLGPIYSDGLAFGETKTFTVNYSVPTPSGDVSNTITASGSDILGSIVSDSVSWFVKVQYQITVIASPAGAIGGTFTVAYTQSGTIYTDVQKTTIWTDWVDSGTIVTVSNPQDFIDGTAGTRYKFDDYDPSFNVIMTEPRIITLVYGTQYYLTVTCPYDSPTPTSGWFDDGTEITASVSSPWPPAPTDTRYVCTGWTGAGKVPASGSSASVAFTMSAPSSITWIWKVQHYLTVTSPYDTAGGQGWYDNGATAYATLSDGVVSGGAGARHVFTGWSGDASGTGLTSAAITMDGPKTATAEWKTQYYLTVNSAHATTGGMGWYDSGTTAHATLTTGTVSGGAGTRYVFTRWSGDASGTGITSNAVTMDRPKTAAANWKTQYYLTVDNGGHAAVSGEGWYDSGASATFSITSTIVNDGAGIRYVFTHWSGASTSTSPSATILMDGPKTVTANWNTQYYLTLATSPPDIDAPSGAGWYDAGTYASISTAQFVDVVSGSSRYRFDNWTTSDTSEMSDSSALSTTVFVDGAKTVTANYVLQGLVTFDQTGLDETAVGTVVTVDGSQKAYGDLPFSVWVENGSVITYSYEGSVSSGVEGKRFRLDGVEGPVSTVAIGESATITGRYLVQYKVTFAQTGLSSDAVGNIVTVNASEKTLHDLPLEIWVDAGSILNYSYKAIVSSAVSGRQYRLESVAGPASPITVATTTTVTGNYKAQYYLTMNTNFGAVSPGSGWHDAGSTIHIGASPPDVIEGERYAWLGWSGSGSGSYSGADNPASITMNGPVVETATWRHEYYLTVASIHGSPMPTSEWFAAGTEISASVASELSGPTGTHYVCTGWAGTGSVSSTGAATSTTFTINEPSSITWNWKTQYYLTMSTNMGTVSPGDGWHDEGSIVSISASPPQTVEGRGYVWHGWAGIGAGSFSALDNPADITVNSPISQAAYWKILPELTIFVSNETIETCDRVAVHGTTAPVYSTVDVDITYAFPNGTQITRTVQTDEQGNYNDTLPLDGESLYGLFAQGGQWTITAKRSGDINREDTTGSTTLGIEAPGLSQINPIVPVLLVAIAVALSYLILHKRLNGKKSTSTTWRLAAIMLATAGLTFTVTSLVMNWMAIAGTATTDGQTYLVNIRLYPYNFGSVAITKMQYIGANVPSLIDSAWRNIPKSPGPIIALYSAPIGCALALACLYKPKTQTRKTAKAIILAIAGMLILIPVIQSFIFVQAQASTTAGASTGYGIGQYIAMIGGLLIGLSSLFSARETPTSEKLASPS